MAVSAAQAIPDPISVETHRDMGKLFERYGRTCWHLYAPAMALAGSRTGWQVVAETQSGSLILYRVRERDGRRSAEILTPPMPCAPGALAHAVARIREITGRSTVRIRHVEEPDLAAIARAGFALRLRDEEFLYDAADLVSLDGPGLKRVRREIGKTRRHAGLSLRDYAREDESGCREVLDRWRSRLAEAGLRAEGYGMTARCLRRAAEWSRELVRGRVCEIDGRIRGFGFAGPISPSCCSMFLCVTDVEFRGLGYLMRHDMVLQWPGHARFNMGGDGGRPGLRAMKESFRPARIAPIFRAVLT